MTVATYGATYGLDDERLARIALSMIAEPGDAVTGLILKRAGASETVRLIDSDSPVPGLDDAQAQAWRDGLTAQLSPERAEWLPYLRGGLEALAGQAIKSGFDTVIPGDVHWPVGLSDLGPTAPYLLWTHGRTALLSTSFRDRVTVTGARSATPYGMEVAKSLAADMAGLWRVIVAGGAYGIEAAAHRGAMSVAGDTIAVLATGVDRRYPSAHRSLLEYIGATGLLVSELPPGVGPTRTRLAARNRLLAALTAATVVVEASGRSSALHTAALAKSFGRGVGAVPGPVTSAASLGTHGLIRDGGAQLVTESGHVSTLLENATVRTFTKARTKVPNRAPARTPQAETTDRRTGNSTADEDADRAGLGPDRPYQSSSGAEDTGLTR